MSGLWALQRMKTLRFLPAQHRRRFLCSKAKGNAGIVFTNNNNKTIHSNGLSDIANEERENQTLIQNMGRLHIESMDKQLSPSAVDISAYLADKRWNRPEGSHIEKEELLELLSLSKTHSVDEIIENFSNKTDDKTLIKDEEIKLLVKFYALPTIEKIDEKLF